MSQVFSEIKIKELDEKASGPLGSGESMRLVLRLSQNAPNRWANYFNDAWKQAFYMMMHSAHASNDHIEINCVPGEFQADHMPELNKVIAEANTAYAVYCVRQQKIGVEQCAASKDQNQS